MNYTLSQRRALVDKRDSQFSIQTQCNMLGIHRSGLYYAPKCESAENLALMRMIDEQYLKTPFYGVPRMTAWLNRQGCKVNRKRIARLSVDGTPNNLSSQITKSAQQTTLQIPLSAARFGDQLS